MVMVEGQGSVMGEAGLKGHSVPCFWLSTQPLAKLVKFTTLVGLAVKLLQTFVLTVVGKVISFNH